MRVRRIAILIDGGFFLKRLPKVVDFKFFDSPELANQRCQEDKGAAQNS